MKGMSEETVNRLLRWYTKQPEAIRIEVHKNQKELENKWLNTMRAKGEKVACAPEMSYSAFITAIKDNQKMFDNRKLNINDDLESVTQERIAALKAKDKKKKAPLKNKVTGDLLLVIERLRKEGFSWEKIREYIALHHKRKISRGYLHRIFTEMKRKTVEE